MMAAGATSSKIQERLQNMRQVGFYQFSLWLLPIAIAVFTLMAFLGFPPLYPAAEGQALFFRSLPVAAGHVSPGHAYQSLRTTPQQRDAHFDDGAWLSIELPERARAEPTAVDFPTRGAQSITCWRPDTMQVVGRALGRSTEGAMRTSRVGYALMLGQNESSLGASFSDLLCQAHYSGHASFSASLWDISDLRAASDRFHRGVALLDGGAVMLALFLAVMALRSREWIFLLLSVWVIGNLRLGTYAMGWDNQWLGYAIPVDWQATLRKLTLAAYFIVTYSLCTALFRHRSGRRPIILKALQALGLAQLLAAFALPWGSFQVLSGVVWALALAAGVYVFVVSIAEKPKRLISWRVATLASALGVTMIGLLYTLTDQTMLLDPFAGIIALLMSNLLVAVAVGGVLREGKKERIRAQTDLVTSYAVTPLGLFTLNAEGHFLRMNPIMRDMLQLKDPTGAVLAWNDFFEPQQWPQIAAATLAGKETEIHFPITAQDGTPSRHFALRVALADEHVEGSLQDITARRLAMDELREIVDSDPLTQALNRRGIEKELDRALELLKTDNVPCSLGYMDLDHFKRINGLFGHTSGDEILKQVTQRVRNILTREQPIGRIGSDEFIMLFPNMTAALARETAERLIRDLNAHSYQVGQRFFQVRSAIGVVEIHRGMDVATSISAATRACRDARKQHQDIVVYDQDSSELQAHTEELRLFDQLEGGASPRGLYLEMQPIMALNNPDQTFNFEILLRVRDSHGRLIPTGQIVSSAEESGTITIIDKWVVSATLEWLSKHDDRLRMTEFVNVNLSGVSLNDDQFVENLFSVLSRYPKLLRRLCVEITEGVALQNIERTRKLIARLQSMGVRIALDDFGAGYTSFSYLKMLGADAVKIDGTFVRDMLSSEANVAIVRTIIELAQNLGMTTIAEWVEDIQTLEMLRELGVDYVQGYVVTAALTPMEILDAESLSDLVVNPDTLSYIRRNSPPPSLRMHQ